MMFDELTVRKIQRYEKSVTRRLPRKDGHRPAIPGSVHKIKIDRTENVYGYIKIISCEKEKLGCLCDEWAKLEGFNTKEEYLQYFKKVNGTDDPKQIVDKITFTLIDNPLEYVNTRCVVTGPCSFSNIVYDDEIAFFADPEFTMNGIYWDLTKYKCEFQVDDYDINYSTKEIWFDISEAYENDYKITTIKEFKEWIQSEDCDFFYQVHRWEEYEWGMRIFLKL